MGLTSMMVVTNLQKLVKCSVIENNAEAKNILTSCFPIPTPHKWHWHKVQANILT